MKKKRPRKKGRFSYCKIALDVLIYISVMNTFEQLKEMLSKRVEATTITEKTTLSDLGLDSLDLVELTLEIEDKYSISFTSGEVADLKTVKDVIELIERKR